MDPDAGLTMEERDLIAEAYNDGILKVLVATCSLAAGINLPARRVILCGARMGRDLVGPALLYVLANILQPTLLLKLSRVGVKCVEEPAARAKMK